jgi:hypothetical protein
VMANRGERMRCRCRSGLVQISGCYVDGYAVCWSRAGRNELQSGVGTSLNNQLNNLLGCAMSPVGVKTPLFIHFSQMYVRSAQSERLGGDKEEEGEITEVDHRPDPRG